MIGFYWSEINWSNSCRPWDDQLCWVINHRSWNMYYFFWCLISLWGTHLLNNVRKFRFVNQLLLLSSGFIACWIHCSNYLAITNTCTIQHYTIDRVLFNTFFTCGTVSTEVFVHMWAGRLQPLLVPSFQRVLPSHKLSYFFWLFIKNPGEEASAQVVVNYGLTVLQNSS
jgi:hypothetical protein